MNTGQIGRPTFGGLATGLDTNALLTGLLELERQPLLRIQGRRSEIDGQRGLMRDLNTKLMALREAAQELDNRNDTGSAASLDEEFLRYSGSSSNEDVVSVSAGAGAAPGAIEVEILELAKGSRAFSTSYTNISDTALAVGGTLTISLADADPDVIPPVEATEIAIEATAGSGALSLQDVRDQINTNEGNGGKVRADILKIAEGNYELVLTTTGTGVSNQMTLGGSLAFETPDPARDVASNSRFRLFGQTGEDTVIERESNSADDVLAGITLKLNRVSETDDSGNTIVDTVTVDVDAEEVAKALEKFTKAYNDVVGFIDRQTRYDESTKTAGPLSGDFTLRQVQGQLRDMISRGYAFSTNESNPFAPTTNGGVGGAISNIGITIEAGGTLKIDNEKLEEALALDPASVREFLSGRARAADNPANPGEVAAGGEADLYDEGFAQLFAVELEDLVRTGDGTLAERDNAFAERLKDFDSSIERFEFRLGQREEMLIQRFSALERIVAGLQGQQGFLTGIV